MEQFFIGLFNRSNWKMHFLKLLRGWVQGPSMEHLIGFFNRSKRNLHLLKFLRGSFEFGRGLNIQIISIEPLVSIFFFRFKGQLISKCLFAAIVWTKIPTKFFPGFLPQPLKRCQIKKIKALYYTNQGLFKIIGIIKFLTQPLLRGQGRNPGKNFVGFLVQTMALKSPFEIN